MQTINEKVALASFDYKDHVASGVTIYRAEVDELDLFHFFSHNRPIDPNHVTALVKSIRRVNKLDSYPIRVTGSGDVIDGQHRLVACRELAVPIYYTIEEEDDFSLEEMSAINSATKPWRMADYLRHYAERGFPEYVKLRRYLGDAGVITVATAAHLMHAGEGTTTDAFKSGGFKMDRSKRPAVLVVLLNEFSRAAVECYDARSFIYAVWRMISQEKYDHEYFLEKKIPLSRAMLSKARNVEEYGQQLYDLYNYRLSGASRIGSLEG